MTLPAGPKTLPILQIMQAVVEPIEILEANFQKYGDWYTARFSGIGPLVVLSSPEAIESVMTAPGHVFDCGRTNGLLSPFLGSNSLVMLDGKAHQRERKLLTPPFHGERLRTYGQSIQEITHKVVEQWEPGQSFSMRTAVQEISLRAIMRTVFGVSEGDKSEQLRHHLNELLMFFDRPLNAAVGFLPGLQKDLGAWSPWGKLVRQREKINHLLYSEIRERRENPERLGDDILSLMIEARYEDGQSMSESELKDEAMTLLFAGHETTATAIAWALYWIHYLPEVGEKLQKELEALGENCDPVTISRLPYLSAICDETLRIYPVALFTFTRNLKKNWKLRDREFEAGTNFSPCIYLLHHRPDVFPEPNRFRPERFLERQYSLYEYMPFGGGNRRCLGMAFALFEMKLVIAAVLSKCRLQLVSDQPVKPVRRGFTMAPEKGVPMRVVKYI
jgi:cytochrome P450 family 110